MANGFPCPNPACTHVFPSDSVKGAAALTCPRCGTTFQFRPGAPAAFGPPAKPTGRTELQRPRPTGLQPPAPPAPRRTAMPPAPPPAPMVPPPVAAVVPATPPTVPAVPLATPVEVEAPAPPPEEPGEEIIARRRLPQRSGSSCGYVAASLLVGLVGLSLIALVVYLVLYVKVNVPQPEGDEASASASAHESRLFNYRFAYPPPPWKFDDDLKLKLHTGIAMRRTRPNAWFAILTRDYKTRTPTDAEMVDEGVRRLQGYFREHFEYEQKPEGELAGRPAQHLEFVGEVNSVEMTGDCYALAASGIGYWFLTWAPTAEKDAGADEWDGIRQGFTLLNEREGWTEKQAKILTLRGKKLDYTLGYAEGLWQPQDDPAAYDPDADAALLGRDPSAPTDAGKTATALVLLLPEQADLKAAVTAARAHLLAQQKKLYPETTLEDADPKAKAGDRPPEEVGNTRGQVLKIRAKNSDALEHFVYLAVVRPPGHTLVLQCECDYRRRTYWEVNFAQLARRLALKQ